MHLKYNLLLLLASMLELNVRSSFSYCITILIVKRVVHVQTHCAYKPNLRPGRTDKHLKHFFPFHSSTASNQLCVEHISVLLKQNKHPVDQTRLEHCLHSIFQNVENTTPNRSDENDADKKKTDDNHSTAITNSPTSDMENLYWHTHGSLLWQRWTFFFNSFCYHFFFLSILSQTIYIFELGIFTCGFADIFGNKHRTQYTLVIIIVLSKKDLKQKKNTVTILSDLNQMH